MPGEIRESQKDKYSKIPGQELISCADLHKILTISELTSCHLYNETDTHDRCHCEG